MCKGDNTNQVVQPIDTTNLTKPLYVFFIILLTGPLQSHTPGVLGASKTGFCQFCLSPGAQGDKVRSQLGGGARGSGRWSTLQARGPLPFRNILLTGPLQSHTAGVFGASETGFHQFCLSPGAQGDGVRFACLP